MSDGPSPALYVYCIAFCCTEQANAPVAQRVIKEVSWRSMMGMLSHSHYRSLNAADTGTHVVLHYYATPLGTPLVAEEMHVCVCICLVVVAGQMGWTEAVRRQHRRNLL